MKKTVVFRLLALSQVSYEVGRYVHESLTRRFGNAPKKSVIVPAMEGTPFHEMDVTVGHTLSDLLPSCKEVLHHGVLRGHVNPLFFCGVSSDNYPELCDEDAVADNLRLLRVVMDHVWHIATMGARRSGYLLPYAAAQHEHLTECQHCIDTALRSVREDLRTRSAMDRLFKRAGFGKHSSSPQP